MSSDLIEIDDEREMNRQLLSFGRQNKNEFLMNYIYSYLASMAANDVCDPSTRRCFTE